MEESEIKSILKEEFYDTNFEESYKRIIIEEILKLLNNKDKQIEKMTKFIIANCYDKIENKLKDDDIAYYGLEQAINQYFKKRR